MKGKIAVNREIYWSRIFILIITMKLCFLSGAFAQEDTTAYFFPLYDTIPDTYGLFENESLLEVTLSFDITYFKKVKPDEEYIDAQLTYTFSETEEITRAVRLRARGNYRYRTCPFPPIRINLENSSLGFKDLSEIDNVKLVTHCNTTEEFEEYMLKEFLIYKLYNIITDYSFRVRLLKINYVDIGDEGNNQTRYAFLIEPVDALEERFKSKEVEYDNQELKSFDKRIVDRVGVFQFMIGNCDWFLPTLHNLKGFSNTGNPESDLLVVPYDFDYSGFVNAEYAVPREDLNLTEIRDRAFVGHCTDDKSWLTVLKEFEGHHDQFIETIKNFTYLDRKTRRDLRNYIDSFFTLYKKEALLELLRLNCVEYNQ
jgi:hypothetical protein